MLPSWQMRMQLPPGWEEGSSKSRDVSSSEESGSGSGVNTLSSSTQPEDHLPELQSSDPMNMGTSSKSPISHQQVHHNHNQLHQQTGMSSNISRIAAAAASENQKQPQHKRMDGIKSEKMPDAKKLRRLAQNREAARKSRIRKKAYLQQLESSRVKLAQLELDLQRVRSQGLFLGGAGGASASMTSGSATFDLEYGKWVENDQKLMLQLRAALHTQQLSEGELTLVVDSYMNHYDEIFRLKAVAAKTDVFHLLTGVWTSPAERCFLWMAGFRPSELLKMLVGRLEVVMEQQLMEICSLQRSCQQTEEALSQGLDQLQHSLVGTIAPTTTPNISIDPMHQMALAVAQLSNLEGFVRQADNLRQQTLHQLRQILTNRQAARCFLMIGDYYGRLRALSSLWASCPKDQMMRNEKNACQAEIDLQMQMVQPSQIHFTPF